MSRTFSILEGASDSHQWDPNRTKSSISKSQTLSNARRCSISKICGRDIAVAIPRGLSWWRPLVCLGFLLLGLRFGVSLFCLRLWSGLRSTEKGPHRRDNASADVSGARVIGGRACRGAFLCNEVEQQPLSPLGHGSFRKLGYLNLGPL